MWQVVRVLGEEWLAGGFTAAQCKKSNDAAVKINFSANKPMRPPRIDVKAVTENGCESGIVGSTNEDDGAGGVCLQIENGMIGHGGSCRRALDPQRISTTRSHDVAFRVIE